MATHSSVLAWRIPGTGSLVGCRLWGRTESDTTEATQQQQQQTQTLTQFTKITPKWIIDEKVKYRIIKLLEVNTGEKPGDILFGMTFFKKEFDLFFGYAGSLLLHKLFSSFGKWGLLSSCPAWATHGSCFSCRGARALGCAGFGSCSAKAQQLWVPGHRAQAQHSWLVGLVAPRRVGPSQTRDRTHASCISRQVLYL